MALPTINPTATNAWKKLQQHYQETKEVHLRELFSEEGRGKKLSIQWNDFLVDYSKNRISDKTLELLLQLANENNLSDWIEIWNPTDETINLVVCIIRGAGLHERRSRRC